MFLNHQEKMTPTVQVKGGLREKNSLSILRDKVEVLGTDAGN